MNMEHDTMRYDPAHEGMNYAIRSDAIIKIAFIAALSATDEACKHAH